MKNIFLSRVWTFCLLVLLQVTLQAQTRSLTIGTANGTVGTITEWGSAEALLKANLPAGATVSDIRLEYSEYDAKFYLTAKVTNASLRAAGIQLQQEGASLRAVGGPGVEITCSGRNCGDCRLIISKWRPKCRCEEWTSSDYACDMTQKAIVTLP